MEIIYNIKDLKIYLNKVLSFSNESILIDQYLTNAIEVDVDAICDGTDVYIIGVMEHVEPCGIHSGDSSAVLPPFDLSDKIIQDMIIICSPIISMTCNTYKIYSRPVPSIFNLFYTKTCFFKCSRV